MSLSHAHTHSHSLGQQVTAHLVDANGGGLKTIYLVKFDADTFKREKVLT